MSARNKNQTPENSGQLTPLDEIRQEEARIAGQVFQAQQEAAGMRSAAQQQAEERKAQAAQNGMTDGTAEAQRRIQSAHEEADQITAAARTKLARPNGPENNQVKEVADWAVLLVLGTSQKDLVA